MREDTAAAGAVAKYLNAEDPLVVEAAARALGSLGTQSAAVDLKRALNKVPARVTGGVAEYFPGVLQILTEKTGVTVTAVPQPILVGAVGAALWALRSPRSKQEQGVA